jgi:plasmid stabilization system protein ParE
MANLEIRAEAQTELDAAYARYLKEGQRVANDFLDEVGDAFQKIEATPELWPRYGMRHRFFPLARHSYVIYYRIESAAVVRIIAISHSARRPGYWKGR